MHPDTAGQEFTPTKAFVIHLLRIDPGAESISGRVEHVLSGESARFNSLPELVRFMGELVERNREAGRG